MVHCTSFYTSKQLAERIFRFPRTVASGLETNCRAIFDKNVVAYKSIDIFCMYMGPSNINFMQNGSKERDLA